jgi:hypothetical protein
LPSSYERLHPQPRIVDAEPAEDLGDGQPIGGSPFGEFSIKLVQP